MFEHDNSIEPMNLGQAARDFKPAKLRKFKTLLLNGFEGSTDSGVITAAIKGVKPEFLNSKRVTVTVGLCDTGLDFAGLLIHENQMEITRVKQGVAGGIIDIPVKINLG